MLTITNGIVHLFVPDDMMKFFFNRFCRRPMLPLFRTQAQVILVSDRGVEQLVARRAHNPKVGGSNPSPATTKSVCMINSRTFSILGGND